MDVGRRAGRPSQLHPQKDVPVGRAVDTVKKIRLEIK
jgi:hypothetical protein